MEPAVSEEQYADLPGGVRLCYQTYGDPGAEPLLLIMGLGGPMTWWNPALCRRFADAGFYVVRYDNRDTGRSSRVEGEVTRGMLVRAFLGRPVRTAYSMTDLADDGVALLDHLGLPAAHVAGVSMGGMIAQTMALEHPGRVLSLVSVMSTTGRRTVGWQSPRLFPTLLRSQRDDRETYVAGSQMMSRLVGSPAYPEPRESAIARAEETYDRGVSPAGTLRQMMAIVTQPDREARLRRLDVPTLVLHGDSDRMVHVSGGRSTAAAVPGAELVVVRGMGHDIPVELHETLVSAVRRTADRARPRGERART